MKVSSAFLMSTNAANGSAPTAAPVSDDRTLDLTSASSLPELSALRNLRVLVLGRQSPPLTALPEPLRQLGALELIDVRDNSVHTL